MMKISRPNLVGSILAGLYAVLLFIAWLPMLLPSAGALSGVGVLLITMPLSTFLLKLVENISIAMTSHLAPSSVLMGALVLSAILNAAMLYFLGWIVVTKCSRVKEKEASHG
jgi:hypothetical protein